MIRKTLSKKANTHAPVKVKVETLVLVRGITGFTVRVVGVELLTRLAVLGT